MGPGLVGGMVIDDDDLELDILFPHHPIAMFGQDPFFMARRNDHGEPHIAARARCGGNRQTGA